ncbi:MAG: alpha/beta hydrolase [Gammaproteobacteria bacterium]|nr:alpha/beta hydrolase [Gammaproteobacteria bacterium]
MALLLSRKIGRKIGIGIFVFYIILVFLFETLLGVSQPEYGSTMVLTSFEKGGESNDRVVARIEKDGKVFVAVNHWPRAWARRIQRNPNVQLTYQGETSNYTAVILEGLEHDQGVIDFSVPLSFRFLTGFPPRYFFRFDPKADLSEGDIIDRKTIDLAAKYGAKVRTLESNGIELRIVEAGDGPLVILVHGWPESWYSWRYQLPALAQAGYNVVAPDMRGYGGSSLPSSIDDYNIKELAADVAGIISALGQEKAVIVGHDWGAPIAWHTALLYPEKIDAVVGLSVLYGGRSLKKPVQPIRQNPEEEFFYISYFQDPGVAEAEFDSDPEALIARLYTSRSPGTPTYMPEVTDTRAIAGGWIRRLGEPIHLPTWLTREDLNYYVSQFRKSGFEGGINYYRNGTLNWELTAELDGAKIQQPALFIAGELDIVNQGATQDELEIRAQSHFEDLRGVVLQPGIGHRNQQQAPEDTNRLLIEFLASLY